MFKGYIAAVVSPFKDNVLDKDGYSKYISWLVDSGINGIVVSGTTGESSALSRNEKINLINTSIETVNKRIPVIVGVGASNTQDVIRQLDDINQIDGIDAIMVVTPFYVKPNQKGIIEHYRMISEVSKFPIVIYNNPGRACVDIAPDTIVTIAKFNKIIALKEASPDLSRFTYLRKALGTNFSLLSGNDDTAPGAFAMGADGAISVSANIIPNLCSDIYKSFESADLKSFSEIRNKVFNIHKLMFKEPSPAPLKYALSLKGFITDEVRMPIMTLSDDTKRMIHDELLGLKLI